MFLNETQENRVPRNVPYGHQNQRTEDMPCILATHRNQLPGRVTPIVTNALNRLLSRPSPLFDNRPLLTQTLDISRGQISFDFYCRRSKDKRSPLRLGCGLLSLGLLSLGFLCGRLLLLGSIGGSRLGLTVVGRGPQGEVVPEQLHDKGAVTVGLLRQGVELSDGVIEGLLGKVAGTIGGVEDLVIEDGEVEGESKTDGVGGGQLGLGNIGGVLWKLNMLAAGTGRSVDISLQCSLTL